MVNRLLYRVQFRGSFDVGRTMIKKVSVAITLFLLTILAVLFIAACDGKFAPISRPQSNVNLSSTTDCRMVEHVMGKTCVPKQPQRFVALNAATLGNAIALGIKPVGSTLEYDGQFPTYLKGKTDGIQSLGDVSQPNIERITRLQPDIVMSWKHNHQSIYNQISKISSTILYDWVGNLSDQNNWKKYFDFMAEVLGRQEIGEQVWQHYNQRIEKLKIALGDRYKNKTVSFVNFCCGGIGSETENSFIGSILSDVGLQRPESQRFNPKGFISFSEETLEMADGDVIFVVAYEGHETGKRDLTVLQQKPLWKKLKAVQQNRVYYVTPTTWRARTPLAADAVIDDLYKYLVNTP
jgi:iron complex transport system substrate-binding protein